MVPPRLHLITDDDVLAHPSFLRTAALVIDACGADLALHVRGRNTDGATLHALAERLTDMCRHTDAWLVVNDRADIAMAVGAQGVQLGGGSLAIGDARRLLGLGCRIGVSTHDPDETAFAAEDGADWVLVGTIFDSASHPDRRPAGLDALRESAGRASAPVIAIGGITPERVSQVEATGAYGVAVLGGVWRADDPRAAAQRYRDAVREEWQQNGAAT